MRLDGAKREGNNLVLSTSDPDAWSWLYNFKPGDYEIKPIRKRRSLDANAYAWVLIHKIAEAVRLTPAEVYKREIKEIGGTSKVVCLENRAVESMIQLWEHNGLGWQAEPFPSKIPGCTNLILYYGSSCFDTKQMSVFIDHLIEEAKTLGIEVLSERELSLLKEGWT